MLRPVFAKTAFVDTWRRFVLAGGGWQRVSLPVRCGLIVHPKHGPVLIDAGYGPRVTDGPQRSFVLRSYNRMFGPRLNPEESPLALLAKHGFGPADVKLVLLTHLHADHVSYARDLPNAQFITDDQRSGSLRHGIFAELLPDDFAMRQKNLADFPNAALPLNLGQGFDLFDDGTVLAVRLPGHAPGHYGLCFPGDVPLLYAVDVQWMRAAITEGRVPGFPASLVASNKRAARQSTEIVRQFAQQGGTVLLCHDPDPTPYDWNPQDV